jgi:hypothetical protein
VSHYHPGFNKNVLFKAALLLSIWLLLAEAAGAAVVAELDRDRIVEGETVTLVFRSDDARQDLDPDVSSLERDFLIIDRRTETQLSIVGGQQTAVVRLVLTLEPRRSGDLVVPSVRFGDAATRPLSLRVEPAPEVAPGEMPPVFIEVEVRPVDSAFYVHAQFGLVVRVFYQQNLTEAAISPPEPEHASVRLLQETPYQAERGGERYRVLERRYAIFPERSGMLKIPEMKLSGRLVERRSGGVWQPSVRGRRITVSSEALELQIEPRPAAFGGGDWLPARDLRLTQQISSSEALRVGEPVTRTVIVDVVGLEENMIGEPAWPGMENARIYPDQPQGITRDDGDWVLGHKEFRYAVVPETAGELVLPELTVEWWDTTANRPRSAVLPEHRLEVLPAALVPTPAVTESVLSPALTAAGDAAGYETAARTGTYWRWLTVLFAALWLLTLLAWRLRGDGGERRAQRSATLPISASEAGVLQQLQQSCGAGERHKARRYLQAWLQRFGPLHSASLLDFAAWLDDEALAASIRALDADGFRPQAEAAWDGRQMWRQFEGWRQGWLAARREHRPPLTDLYAPANRSG